MKKIVALTGISLFALVLGFSAESDPISLDTELA